MEKTFEALSQVAVGRRSPADPFFLPGDAVCKTYNRLGVFDIDDEDLCHEVVSEFPCGVPGCDAKFESLLQFDVHYSTAHRYICVVCRKTLPSPHLLDLHVSESHDSFFSAQAERKPMFRCFVEQCSTLCNNPQERRSHCISQHNFPHDFRFDSTKKQKHTSAAGALMETDIHPTNRSHLKPKTFSFGRGARNSKNWFNQGRGRMKSTDIDTVMKDLQDSLPDQT
ncbi:protein lethal(2)k10201 isoform X5 [Schistocerca gregaria]|nr:protein lethal(2)k10201 isoform X5 [Schistocerca gregaria]XP_049837383.1 protein lethal(2)k10201 isoform X5 [Schistocerca gregaria]XP_049837384.1 protein lethal(2)k10201 isoform X5 [Schistocerca gregaria]